MPSFVPSYRVLAEQIDITDSVEQLSWEETTLEIAMRCQITVDFSPTDVRQLHDKLQIGTVIRVYADEGVGMEERFRGRVWRWEYDETSRRAVTLTAYDPLIHLTKSKDDFRYVYDVPAHDIIRDVSRRYGVPILEPIAIPNVKLHDQYFRGKNVALVLKEVLMKVRLSQKGSGVDYLIRGVVVGSDVRMQITTPGGNSRAYLFEGKTTTGMTDSWDIEDLVTQIIVIGQDTDEALLGSTIIPKPPLTEIQSSHYNDYGIIREVLYTADFGGSEDLLTEAAAQIMAERSEPRRVQRVHAPDVPSIRKGDVHAFKVGTLDGRFIVTGVTHDATSATMTLEIDTSGFLGRYLPYLRPQGPGPDLTPGQIGQGTPVP